MSTRYRTITVGELMGMLSEFEPELPVFIQSGNAFAGIEVDEDTESFNRAVAVLIPYGAIIGCK